MGRVDEAEMQYKLAPDKLIQNMQLHIQIMDFS